MSNRFDPDWPHGHVTREGLKAEIIDRKVLVYTRTGTTDGYAVKVIQKSGGHLLYGITKEGVASPGILFDVFNAPAPKRRVEGHIYVCRGIVNPSNTCCFFVVEGGRETEGDDVIAKVPFTWEEP